MKQSKIIALSLLPVVAVLFAGPVSSVYADHGSKCGKKKTSCKFFKKAHAALKHADEIGLSDEKKEAIRTLKVTTKKAAIRHGADIKILGVDIKSGMYDDTIDMVKMNQLIDQKYAKKAEKAKTMVKAYADLKSLLTEDQLKQLCALKKAEKSKGACGSSCSK